MSKIALNIRLRNLDPGLKKSFIRLMVEPEIYAQLHKFSQDFAMTRNEATIFIANAFIKYEDDNKDISPANFKEYLSQKLKFYSGEVVTRDIPRNMFYKSLNFLFNEHSNELVHVKPMAVEDVNLLGSRHKFDPIAARRRRIIESSGDVADVTIKKDSSNLEIAIANMVQKIDKIAIQPREEHHYSLLSVKGVNVNSTKETEKEPVKSWSDILRSFASNSVDGVSTGLQTGLKWSVGVVSTVTLAAVLTGGVLYTGEKVGVLDKASKEAVASFILNTAKVKIENISVVDGNVNIDNKEPNFDISSLTDSEKEHFKKSFEKGMQEALANNDFEKYIDFKKKVAQLEITTPAVAINIP